MSHIVEQALQALRLASEAKNVRLLMALDENAGPVMGDPHWLQQVVWNLVSNAIKFTPKAGRVHIAVERVDSSLMLSVTDDGRGIEAESFRTYSRGSAGGWGDDMGLRWSRSRTRYSRHIVELHGGAILVTSEGIGVGAKFQVILPMSPVRSNISFAPLRRPSVESRELFAKRPELSGLKVLLVEDEDDARELLVAILSGSARSS